MQIIFLYINIFTIFSLRSVMSKNTSAHQITSIQLTCSETSHDDENRKEPSETTNRSIPSHLKMGIEDKR